MSSTKQEEREEKIKALRKELEEKLEEQLPQEMLTEKVRVEIQKIDEGIALDPAYAKQVVEALLFASSKPLTPQEIRRVIKTISPSDITKIIEALAEEFKAQGRSFEILEIAGGYEIATKKEFAPWILKVEMQKKAKQVTQSALETLAILAYKQPITRAEIEELRGVDVSGVITNLVEKGLVKISGRKEVPGRPFLYVTTEKFLEHFGLNSLDDLPDIQEIKQLVENSVRKDELLGTTKLVEMAGAEEASMADAGSNQNAATEEAPNESEPTA